MTAILRNIVLASSSPRRKDILDLLGLIFSVDPSDFPEEEVDFSHCTDPSEFVCTIATGKALVVGERHKDAIVIGADTGVFCDGEHFGKPRDLQEASAILKRLSGKEHVVVTGFCILDSLTGDHRVGAVESHVVFHPLSQDQIDRYVQTGESMGKAGAYAIQMGARTFVRSVVGSVSNVVGLPMLEVAGVLEEFGVPIMVDVLAAEQRFFSFH